MNNTKRNRAKGRLPAIIAALLLLVLIFTLCSCSSGGDKSETSAPMNGEIADDTAVKEGSSDEEATAERKIIYTANVGMSTYDFDGSVAKIRESLKGDEWFDSERVSDGYAYFAARVKSDRLDAFIAAISADAENVSLEKNARDVSLAYQSKEDKLIALTEEKTLLQQYLDSGDITPSAAITRISEINTEIKRINGELAAFDSQIEYSTVYITVNKLYAEDDPSYKEKADNTLDGAWRALGEFFRFLGLAAVAILPWLLLILPVTAIVILAVRFKKRKKPFQNVPKREGGRKPRRNKNALSPDDEGDTNDKNNKL